MNIVLLNLALVFIELSVLAFGGGNAILPEMKHQVVDVHHWMTAQEFSAMFAMSQAAPGPNMMIVPLIGWHVAGMAGLLVTSLAKFVPSSLITMATVQYWERYKHHNVRIQFEKALKPITVSLVMVSAVIISESSAQNYWLAAIILLTASMSFFKNIHPLWVMVTGAITAIVLL
ncbi:MAG: chromate transporter [Acinetobacter populi]|jgi:chromate transporter|uniref:chromate transporter n=1 Tax=Acinetobacter populi TaxID=1582270 RepID=UPI00235686F8|nr:chromate transporter [Acinetobacter populi]MCH4246860.1 chromate transporter [Acinetobacter populi]